MPTVFLVLKDLFSNEVDLYFVGIESKATFQQDLGIISSFINATIKTYDLSISTLTVLKYLATGQRSLKAVFRRSTPFHVLTGDILYMIYNGAHVLLYNKTKC